MQILKFSKTDISQSLGTRIEELNKDLPEELKNALGWKEGKKQSFSPAKTKMILQHWGSYREVKNLLQSCV
jgi:hypothetical protein